MFEFSKQVLSESLIETDVEIARLQDISRNDVVVLDQVEMRHSQVEAKNHHKIHERCIWVTTNQKTQSRRI